MNEEKSKELEGAYAYRHATYESSAVTELLLTDLREYMDTVLLPASAVNAIDLMFHETGPEIRKPWRKVKLKGEKLVFGGHTIVPRLGQVFSVTSSPTLTSDGLYDLPHFRYGRLGNYHAVWLTPESIQPFIGTNRILYMTAFNKKMGKYYRVHPREVIDTAGVTRWMKNRKQNTDVDMGGGDIDPFNP